MDTDRKAYNSTLRPISKKRLTRIYNAGEIIGCFTILGCLNPKSGLGVHRMYKVRCNKCGKEIIVRSTLLKSQGSCGCVGREKLRIRSTIHGHYYERLHRIWYGVKKRCQDPNDHAYKDYGGRGIALCKEWEEYDAFYKWAIYAGYRQNLTIERKDVNGDYCPENCKFISQRMQATNKRNSMRTDTGISIMEMAAKNDIKGLRKYGLTIWPKAIKKKAGYKCELCGEPGDDWSLDAHHWAATKASVAPTDLWLSNGCCLCRNCHIAAHQYVAAYKAKIEQLKGINALNRIEIGKHRKLTTKDLIESIRRIRNVLKRS